jgi:DNA-binding LytR/AlgR family response regulator
LVYETGDNIITKLYEPLVRAELETKSKLVLYGNKQQLELINPNRKTIQLLLDSGFLQVHKNHFINTEYIIRIRIEEHKIELLNGVTIPYTVDYKKNIENFLKSITIINH